MGASLGLRPVPSRRWLHGRAGWPGCLGGGWWGGEGALGSQLFTRSLAFCASAENLDELREEREKSPPEPHTPPSSPVKLEEGEHRPAPQGGCTIAGAALWAGARVLTLWEKSG